MGETAKELGDEKGKSTVNKLIFYPMSHLYFTQKIKRAIACSPVGGVISPTELAVPHKKYYILNMQKKSTERIKLLREKA